MAEVMLRVEEASDKKKRRIPVVILSCLLVFALIGGGTLAYLTTVTNTESNVFTAGNIKAQLSEVEWDSTGSAIAEKMLPGITAPKDPMITNTSDFEESEYTGIMLVFEKAKVPNPTEADADWQVMDATEVDALLTGVGTNTTGANVTSSGLVVATEWGSRIDTVTNVTSVVDGQRVFMYNSTIAQGDSTEKIFKAVGIIPGAGNDPWASPQTVTADNFMSWLYSDAGCKGHFRITVKGAAVQATGVSAADAQKSILTLFGYTPQP